MENKTRTVGHAENVCARTLHRAGVYTEQQPRIAMRSPSRHDFYATRTGLTTVQPEWAALSIVIAITMVNFSIALITIIVDCIYLHNANAHCVIMIFKLWSCYIILQYKYLYKIKITNY